MTVCISSYENWNTSPRILSHLLPACYHQVNNNNNNSVIGTWIGGWLDDKERTELRQDAMRRITQAKQHQFIRLPKAQFNHFLNDKDATLFNYILAACYGCSPSHPSAVASSPELRSDCFCHLMCLSFVVAENLWYVRFWFAIIIASWRHTHTIYCCDCLSSRYADLWRSVWPYTSASASN